MEISTALLFAFIVVVAFLFIFLLIREIMLWYWKVNTVVKNLEEIQKTGEAQSRLLQTTNVLLTIMAHNNSSRVQIQHKTSGETKNLSISQYINNYSYNNNYEIVAVQ